MKKTSKVIISSDGMEVQLENDEWIEKDGKNYCPECISFDDEDNLVLKSKPNDSGTTNI